jgi:hypothetical protein
MGRDKEFKVGKAFTLGLAEIQFLKVECDRTGKKASSLINRWIRDRMEGHVEEIRKVKGPESYCSGCGSYKEYFKNGKTWNCDGCGEDKTSLIEGMIRRSKH